MIVYMNGSDIECTLIVEVGFHVAKEGDGRHMGHIHIVSGITVLSKLIFSRWYEVLKL